ncbi:MAG: triosephosphate isomerase [Planctomycetota bacterium]|nr:MAG: triosephosphate isomerase [Planctomycetota bacterium]
MSRRTVIAGNWKMHKTLSEARELVSGLRQRLEAFGDSVNPIDVLIFPPATLLFPMAKAIAGSRVLMGAQNAHDAAQGAFTGEISMRHVADTGCTHVLVGHSERRHVFGESAEFLARKVVSGVAAGLTVVYCVGETLAEREADRTASVVGRHLDEGLSADLDFSRIILAYEPVWAIGTGRTATPQQAQEVHQFIRTYLSRRFGGPVADGMRVLYGGSVKPDNARGLLQQADIDGLLVGGACLSAEDFAAIIGSALSQSR